MSPDEVRTAVLAAVQQVAPEAELGRVATTAPLRDELDIDSFDFLQILVAIEARVGVNVPERDYGRIVSLDDLVSYVQKRV